MTLDLGDEALAGAAIMATLPANAAGTAGDAVTWDAGNDRVDATDATNESVFGILSEDAPSTAGDRVGVWIAGPVVGNVAAGVVQGDILVTTATEGQLDTSAGVNARTVAIDEGGTTNHGEVPLSAPYALSDVNGTNPLQESMTLPSNAAVVVVPY